MAEYFRERTLCFMPRGLEPAQCTARSVRIGSAIESGGEFGGHARRVRSLPAGDRSALLFSRAFAHEFATAFLEDTPFRARQAGQAIARNLVEDGVDFLDHEIIGGHALPPQLSLMLFDAPALK